MQEYDLIFLGHYTKDTIISPKETRVVDGGAFNYGSHLAARMGLRTAAVTRLAEEDQHVVRELEGLGVDVYATYTPCSTCLTLKYPSSNLDERLLSVTSRALPFLPRDVENFKDTPVLIGASVRGEVSLEVIEKLKSNNCKISLDVQGFIRVISNGSLVYAPWPEKKQVLGRVDVLKTDAVEAELITGTADIAQAAKMLAGWGPKEVVLTHKGGVLIYAQSRYFAEKFFPEKIEGRSGRGDTCIAAYMIARLSDEPEKAAVFAAAATSLKLEAEGPFKRNKEDIAALISSRYS